VLDARLQSAARGSKSLSEIREGEDERLVYHYKPRMIGSGFSFRLGEHSLEWNMSGLPGQVPYPMIAMVRLGFRPSNFGNRRFTAEIWPTRGAKVEIASASYKSMVSMEDLGPEYRAFIVELHRRIAAAGSDCKFEAGFAAWRWWPMAAVGIATGIALLYVGATTLLNGDTGAATLVAGFMGLFAWQMWPLISRNRPVRYDPQHIPAQVLP
jgi:hypothetical protein